MKVTSNKKEVLFYTDRPHNLRVHPSTMFSLRLSCLSKCCNFPYRIHWILAKNFCGRYGREDDFGVFGQTWSLWSEEEHSTIYGELFRKEIRSFISSFCSFSYQRNHRDEVVIVLYLWNITSMSKINWSITPMQRLAPNKREQGKTQAIPDWSWKLLSIILFLFTIQKQSK